MLDFRGRIEAIQNCEMARNSKTAAREDVPAGFAAMRSVRSGRGRTRTPASADGTLPMLRRLRRRELLHLQAELEAGHVTIRYVPSAPLSSGSQAGSA